VAIDDPEQSHILLALPVALWLAALRRARLAAYKPKASWLGAVLIVGGWTMSLIGFAAAWDIFWHAGAILVVGGAVVAIGGHRLVLILLPSCFALFFLLPVPGRIRYLIAGPLQTMSASAAEFGMDLMSIPVIRNANALTVNGTTVQVAEACNGMRMVSALAVVAFVFVFSVPMRNSVRLLILATSPIIAVIVNVIRLIPTALFYGYSTEDMAGLVHDISGWAVLPLALGLLWLVLFILRWIEVPIAPYPVAKLSTK
jgi:exosortase